MPYIPWRITIRVVSALALVVSSIWFVVAPDWEPLVTCLAALATLLGTLISEPQPAPAVDPAANQRNLTKLLQKVENFWIKQYLDVSVQGTQLDLVFARHPSAVESALKILDSGQLNAHRDKADYARLLEVYDESGGALLLLGGPGSGKTTSLLQLTRALIRRAYAAPDNP